jgi:serine phosphatase RsbU (regulator of sigma subunit)
VRVDARYLPALEVGGDFYEVSYLGNGRTAAVVGDVSGRGVSAALIMSRVSSDIRRAVRSGLDPSQVLENVNATLSDIESERFVTASCIALDSRHQTLTVANAGHVPLVVLRAGGEVFEFGSSSGTPLGVATCEYLDERVALRPRDIVLLMTDGLVDALEHQTDSTMTTLLHRIVESAPHDPEAINERILEAASDTWSSQLRDDVTLVALQLE